MRVIAGEFRGRPLLSVPGKGTRPTADKVKESVFNMIGPFFDGGWALDLYAGTGALGIEALSRGMERAVFVDMDPKAVSVVRKNVATLGLEARCEIYRTSAGRALKALENRGVRFRAVFLDPPYREQRIAEEVAVLEKAGLLEPEAWVVAEHAAADRLPETIGRCVVRRAAVYGDTGITLYRLESGGNRDEDRSVSGQL